MTSIAICRDMRDFHKQVHEVEALKEHLGKELQGMKKELLEKAKELQDQSACYISRAGYFQRMTTSNYRGFMELPFMKPEGITVYDKIFEIAQIPDYRTQLPKFMKAFYKCLNDMPPLLAKLDTQKHFGVQPFLPDGVKLSDFMASSTLPAVFGHLFTKELKIAYIKFLVEIAKNLPPDVYDNFREHWLFDCIKAFIHSSDIRLFLQKSLQTIIIDAVRDEMLVQYIKTRRNQELFEKISVIIRQILKNMEENFSIFPEDVRYFLYLFSDLASDEETKIKRLEIILLDSIIIPAISLPKVYGVLPPTFYFDKSPLGPARVIQMIAQAFRLILHPGSADRYGLTNVECLVSIPFREFLIKLPSSKPNLPGLKLQDFINNLGIFYVLALFSVPDVVSLAYLVRNVNLTTARAHIDLLKIASDFPIGSSTPYVFFRFEHWNLPDFLVESPQFPENKVSNDGSQESACSNSLYQLLSYLEYRENCPPTINAWLNFQMNDCLLQRDFKKYIYLQHYLNLAAGETEDSQITPGLEEIIRNYLNYTQCSMTLIKLGERQIADTKKELENFKSKTDLWLPIYHDIILQQFLEQDQSVLKDLTDKVHYDVICEKGTFDSFLLESLTKLKKFLGDNNLSSEYKSVAKLLHSYIMSYIPLKLFMKQSTRFVDRDKTINENRRKALNEMSKAPPKVSKLFDFPPLFTFAIQEIENAIKAENPDAAIECLSRSLELLRRIYILEIGGLPQPDDLNPLFGFAVFSTGNNTIYSFLKYVSHFMFMHLEESMVFLPKEQEQAIRQVMVLIDKLSFVFPFL
ncbi:hypothetical protein TVAG_249000 [Trichomonas vaginalis G3]|uniref:VPS9 domain-containing protein n=1 Tax=Trichomonas vaginalis (strain ATCC PRA-98 / G3) TaxID=412133 RepID=A2DCA4_TRIV3|nr:VPS9 domain family [Trichomonas vaginalis G3]EAY21841.1 hypothetical protein TVAG_249000 [Trichomonas vaginalis G3]KAI5487689.1 VPS9 domain family [Trichomonas vaginalis G3]|eukprot:XP_001582827.1 hypothetical protein [Trichomonas vaginalis G3]